MELSKNVIEKLAHYLPNKVLELPKGRLLFFIDLTAAEILESCGYLNVVFVDVEGKSFVVEKASLGDGKDKSAIVGGSLTGEYVLLGHWNGFESIFDFETFRFREQRFTK